MISKRIGGTSMFFEGRKIVLASASPRRLDILRQLGIEPLLCAVEVAEENETTAERDAEALVAANAALKAKAAAKLYEDGIIIGADTMVMLRDVPFGKPRDAQEAEAMLLALSNTTHQVYTGICLIDKEEKKSASGVDVCQVTFQNLTKAEIAAYIASGEPMDKAGAYGIQGQGAAFVKKINGDYNTVVGLSVSLLRQLAAIIRL